MCVTSMIGDYYKEKFNDYTQWVMPIVVTRAEFDELKRQVAEMVDLLKRAQDYDKRNNEPACEIDDKMDVLRRVAKLVGIDLDAAVPGLNGAASGGDR